MNSNKKSIALVLLSFFFLSLALTSCDRHTCPTYSKTTEKPVENKG